MACCLIHPKLFAKQYVRIANDSATVQRHIVQTDNNGCIKINDALHAPLGVEVHFEDYQPGVAGRVSCLVYDSRHKQLFITSNSLENHPGFSFLHYDNADNVVTSHRQDILLEGTSLNIRAKSSDSFADHKPKRYGRS